mgnify:CR=1 FL=1
MCWLQVIKLMKVSVDFRDYKATVNSDKEYCKKIKIIEYQAFMYIDYSFLRKICYSNL